MKKYLTALNLTGVGFFSFGLVLLTVPVFFAELYGATLEGFGIHIARLWGSANAGLGVICLFASPGPETSAQRAVIIGLMLINVAYTVIYLLLTQFGQINWLGWGSVLTHVTLGGLLLFRLIMGPSSHVAANE